MSEFTTEPNNNDYNNNLDDTTIKLEANQELPNFENATTKEWDAGMELALLNAISRCKPVGK
jgi:hypothetical protein